MPARKVPKPAMRGIRSVAKFQTVEDKKARSRKPQSQLVNPPNTPKRKKVKGY